MLIFAAPGPVRNVTVSAYIEEKKIGNVSFLSPLITKLNGVVSKFKIEILHNNVSIIFCVLLSRDFLIRDTHCVEELHRRGSLVCSSSRIQVTRFAESAARDSAMLSHYNVMHYPARALFPVGGKLA